MDERHFHPLPGLSMQTCYGQERYWWKLLLPDLYTIHPRHFPWSVCEPALFPDQRKPFRNHRYVRHAFQDYQVVARFEKGISANADTSTSPPEWDGPER